MNENTDIIKNGEQAVCRKLKKIAATTADLDYDITLRIGDRDADGSEGCTHHLKGNSKRSLMTLLTIGGLIAAAAAAVVCYVHVFCSMVCRCR